MPWKTGRSFATAHNRKLRGAAAGKAARVATAMVNRGLPEGEAIATGNKIGDSAMRGSLNGMGPRVGRVVDAAPRVTNSRASKSRSWTGS